MAANIYSESSRKQRVAVVGSGPAGLMASDVLAEAGCEVTLFEKRKAPAWKLFIAGSSGLNISHQLPLPEFAAHYTGPADLWLAMLKAFPPELWLKFIEDKLGLGTFLGTSRRYFVETMHAAKLVRHWRRRLQDLGVSLEVNRHWVDFEQENSMWRLDFSEGELGGFDAVCLCLGGASYETEEIPLLWPRAFTAKGLSFQNFSPSNTGYSVAWSEAFLKEAEGEAIKNIVLRNARGERKGDLVITSYGLEGTPIYFLGETGPVTIDLKPDLDLSSLSKKLQQTKENLSPLRRAQKQLRLNKGAQALLFHMAPKAALTDCEALAQCIKAFPLDLLAPRPLSESISSRGGVAWDNLDEGLMLNRYPGIFLAGEMIEWDAPTGGFLIQACVTQGYWAAQHILSYLGRPSQISSP